MHVYPNGTRRPIAYASQTLNEHEKRYDQIDKEALTIMFGLKRFHVYLYGRHFTILTDHKPLERIFGPKTPIPSLAAMRLQRWAIMLAAFNYSIKFVPSKENAVADALSRLPLPSTAGGESAVFKVEECLIDCLLITQKEILNELHVGHPGIIRMKELARSYLWWPNIDSDIEQTVRNCSRCQQVRKPPAAAPLAP